MHRVDELHLDYPFAGKENVCQGLLKAEGFQTGGLHIAVLMEKKGFEAIYRRLSSTAK